MQAQAKATSIPPPSFTPMRSRFLQRRATDRTEPSAVPPIVHEALRSLGQSLDPSAYVLKEPHFDHDFSRVPVRTAAPMMIQPKLAIGQPGDKYEQEADRVADIVMSMPEPHVRRQVGPEEEEEETVQTKPLAAQITPLIQRQVEPEEEEEQEKLIQAKLTKDAWLQRQEEEVEEEEEQEPIQAKQAEGQVPQIGRGLEARIRSLRGGGRPLSTSVRSFFEARFRHDLGRVRIHTGTQAAAAAQALNARSFTLGQDVVFGAGRFAPGTGTGRRLLAHELTHVVQQDRHRTATRIQRVSAQDATQMSITEEWARALDNVELVEQTRHVREQLLTLDPRTPEHEALRLNLQVLEAELARRPRAAGELGAIPVLPGYSQAGVTCGAASLVTALIIWDREERVPSEPNHLVVTACNLVLVSLEREKSQLIEEWKNRVDVDMEALYQQVYIRIREIRDAAHKPGAIVTEQQYKDIAGALYYLYVDESAGLTANEIEYMQRSLGLFAEETAAGFRYYDDVWTNYVIQSLRSGDIAQVSWYVRTGPAGPIGVPIQIHAFLIGRLQDGTYFLSDQGAKPTVEIRADTLTELQTRVTQAASEGRSRIYLGEAPVVAGGWTGVRLLAGPEGVEQKAVSIIPPGTFLAEVDAGDFTLGERLHSGDFVGQYYESNNAQEAARGLDEHGAIIVEMPEGVYNVYETNLVSESNAEVTEIDKVDSTNGLLMNEEFHSVWLLVRSRKKATLLQVY
jgi:hypothetical protein